MNERTLPKKPLRVRFSAREQVMFAKRLAMILRSGAPVGEALAMLASECHSSSAAYIFAHVSERIARGQALSVGLSAFASTFGEFSLNIVRVGESSGMLHQNLEYLSEELKKKDALKRKVQGALVYPAVIIVATIGISTMLTVYIFPKILPIFQSFKQQLPLPTRILIFISEFLIKDGIWLLLFLILAAVALFFLLKKERIRRNVDQCLLYLPVVGSLSRFYNLSNIMRTASLLLRGDVRVVQALDIVARGTRNLVYREQLEEMARHVARGEKLSAQMRASERIFPALCSQMISSGEATGNLPESLMYLSDMYEEELRDLTTNLTTLFEPVLMIAMGLVVGFIAISIITPIYGITQNLSPH